MLIDGCILLTMIHCDFPSNINIIYATFYTDGLPKHYMDTANERFVH